VVGLAGRVAGASGVVVVAAGSTAACGWVASAGETDSSCMTSSTTTVAGYIGVSPILIGMFIVGLGTTMPEFFFSLKSVGKRDDSLAVGDILGTVLADATIVVGILALVSPFSFPQKIIFVTGIFMVVASFLLFYFMKSGRRITKKEAHLLFFFWVIFVLVEFIVNR
jgi:cation:H+ antiporter